MRHSFRTIGVLALSVAATPAFAGGGPVTTWTAETVASSNILDDGSELGDIGLHLRGALSESRDTGIGTLHFETAVDLLNYRRYHFADQQTLSVNVSQARGGDGPLSYTSHLGYAIGDSGDDLALAGVVLGLRQAIQNFSGGGSLKLELGDGMTAALGFEERYDDVGKARFAADLPDTKVNPDRNLASGSFGIAKKADGVEYGLIAKVARISLFQQTPFQNAVPFDSYALRGRFIIEDAGGWRLTGEIGFRQLRDGLGIYDRVRPVYALAAERAFAAGFKLSGRLTCDFETDDTDDPLATYRRRLEIEASVNLPYAVVLGAGAFVEAGDNLLLENRERGFGVYGAVGYKPQPRLQFLLRVDYDRRRQTIIDVDEDTLAARFGVRTSL